MWHHPVPHNVIPETDFIVLECDRVNPQENGTSANSDTSEATASNIRYNNANLITCQYTVRSSDCVSPDVWAPSTLPSHSSKPPGG